MKNLVGLLILMFGLGSITAQSYNKQFSLQPNQLQNYSSADTLKILAVMVEFQEDKYDATIGTGKFGSHYSKVYGDTILDPLPHNAEYFSDHLLFARNYFSKVSKGKLNIAYKVLPEVITVSQTMREYVPGYNSKDFSPLGKFSEEVWKLADQKFTNVKFSDYNLFVIFHAGVSSASSIGAGVVNRNMPSLYLSNASLKQLFGNQFQGFNTKTGKIGNTLIMSETESREEEQFDGSKVLNQITINGILVGNIGSHIGLPDLFNTETGRSAIGRFGLMDGQAMASHYGMFPPELSPWERIYLGWETPKEISLTGGKVNISARQTAALSDTTLLKIPINTTEYFLVENRQNDAKKDELILTIKKGKQVYQKTVKKDTSGVFFFLPTDIKGGNIIDVDEFDSALPGSGIVVWHIDEKIISSSLSSNTINNVEERRGVDVEEADGIQDIGQIFRSVFGDMIGEGTKFDFWYKGNKSKLYKNVFSPNSKPTTNTNYGGNSLITIDSFSDLSNKMSFNVSFGNDQQKLVASFNLPFTAPFGYKDLLLLQGQKGFDIFVYSNSNLKKYSSDGKLQFQFDSFSSIAKPVGTVFNSKQYVAGTTDNQLFIYWKDISNANAFNNVAHIKLPAAITSNLVLSKRNNLLYITAGFADGKLLEAEVEKLIQTGTISNDQLKLVSSKEIFKIARPYDDKDSYYSINNGTDLIDSKSNSTFCGISKDNLQFLIKDGKGEYLNVVYITYKDGTNNFSVIKNGKIERTFSINIPNLLPSFSCADLFNDGRTFLLTVIKDKLFAFDLNGKILENFPVTLYESKNFTPVVADVNKDGLQEIFVMANSGNLYAINPKDGKVLSGYPISNGEVSDFNPVLFSEELPTMGPLPTYKPYIASIDRIGRLNVWSLSSMQGKANWSAPNGNFSGNSFLELTNTFKTVTEYFPIDKAYNWPNPVYGNSSTKIRFYVSENSNATVRIFDLAGALVAKLTGLFRGGFENEIEWNVSNVQSGVYYASLEVQSESGKTANKIIKIAVIK